MKKQYKNLNLVKVVAIFSVLLYHLKLLDGGYLAVCTFFVISGYLSSKTILSKINNKKFKISEYYKKRFIRLYIPLLIVVFITVFLTSLFKNINWLNLKQETTSVLLGYNNFWQLKVNVDYFARHISSPFMHLWYISILIQFDLIIPLIVVPLKKLGDKVHKLLPCIILFLLTLGSAIYFYLISNDIMFSYYNTLSRIYAPLLGVLLSFIHIYYSNLVFKNKKFITGSIITYLLILCILFITINASSKYYVIGMILTTIISARLVDYSTVYCDNNKQSIIDRLINYTANRGYEIYLVQYPIIFIFGYITLNKNLKLLVIVLLVFIISSILNYVLTKKKIFKYILLIPIVISIVYGCYLYIISIDHTKEIEALKVLLEENSKKVKQQEQVYLTKMEEQKNYWNKTLNDLEQSKESLKETITNLPLVGVGDSVMLGAVGTLYQTFPNSYFDAKVSRTDYEASAILENLRDRNLLGNPVIFNLGTNGQCGNRCRNTMLEILGDRKIFWVNVTNDDEVHVNDDLKRFADTHDNVWLVDWNNKSNGHKEYFYADGIHLTGIGQRVYANTLFEKIYEVYEEEYNNKKEKILDDYKNEVNEQISFYGNDILINSFASIQESFPNAQFILDKNFNRESLLKRIKQDIKDKKITHKIVLAFDNISKITKNDYKQIIELLNENEIYILQINDDSKFEQERVTTLNVKLSNTDLLADNLHLNDSGNKKLIKVLNTINKTE